MNLLAIETSQMFTSIRESRKNAASNFLAERVHSHFCTSCGQIFSAKFGFIAGMGWQRWQGDNFCCPSCGKRNYNNYLTTVRESDTKWEPLPYSLRIVLGEFKTHLKLSITGRCIVFMPNGIDIIYDVIKEDVIFDIQSRKVIFKSNNVADAQELGNPFLATPFIKHSLLRFVLPESSMYREQKQQVSAMIKMLREHVGKKMKEIHGINLKAMAIRPDKRYGLFLLPIVNIAWRIACPDAKNLPLFELAANSDTDNYGYYLEECRRKHGEFPLQLVEDVMAFTRAGLSYPQSVAKAYGLPDTKGIRKLLAEQDIFRVGTIKIGFDMMRDHKYRLLAAKQALVINGSDYYRMNRNPKTLSKFIKQIVNNFGDKIAAKLLLDFERLQVADTMSMYSELTRENKKRFMNTRLTAERMHGWLIEVLDNQKHEDYELHVPDDFIKRVEMRMGLNKFFVPKTAHELRCAGKKLRNCVGSYAKSVLAREADVVLVSDKKGDLIICIEVCNNEIIQAKLFGNARVEKDPVLNEQVKAWAKKAELKIVTFDVNMEEPEKTEQLIAV